MKTKATETKFKSTLPLTRRLLSSVLCLGAVILTSSSAPAQNLFMSSNDGQTGVIFEFTPDGTQSTFASGLSNPQGLVFDSSGNLFVADSGAIYKFGPDGVRTTFALGLSGPIGLAIDSADNLFVPDWCTGSIHEFTPNRVQTTFGSGSRSAGYLAFQSTETSPPTATPRVTVSVSANRISQGADATFTISVSTMNPSQVTTVHYAMSGKARSGTNYTLSGVSGEADIPAGASSTTVTLHALNAPMRRKSARATMTIMPGPDYTLSNPKRASVAIVK
jgi:hypothetical protein